MISVVYPVWRLSVNYCSVIILISFPLHMLKIEGGSVITNMRFVVKFLLKIYFKIYSIYL